MLQVVERKRRPGTWSRGGAAYQYTTNGLIEILGDRLRAVFLFVLGPLGFATPPVDGAPPTNGGR